MKILRAFTTGTDGEYSSQTFDYFGGGLIVNFIGIVENGLGTNGQLIGIADSDDNNEIQISINPRGAKKEYFMVRQGYKLEWQDCAEQLEITVRYLGQVDGYIELLTYNLKHH